VSRIRTRIIKVESTCADH